MSQYTDVKRICDDLESSGKAVSLDYLLSKVSDAQASVVSHYKKWRTEQGQQRQQDNLSGFSEDFIAAFQREAQKQTQWQTDQLTKQLAEALQAEVKAVEQVQALQQQIQQLQAQLETVEAVAQDPVTREALEAERDEAIAAAARQADQVA